MKKKLPHQDNLIDLIMDDINTVPPFIDGKKDLAVFRLMQEMLYAIMKLITKQVFLSDYQIELIDNEMIDYSVQLSMIADEGLHSLIVVYLNKKLMGYHDIAMEDELFEAASNIKKFFERV